MNWKAFTRKAPPTPARLPEGLIAYAIGDIHGQGDLAYALMQHIVDQAGVRGSPPVVIIGLGDYVDRGRHSRYVLDLLISLQNYGRIETHFLSGNHEAAMLDFMDGRSDGAMWFEFGGLETLNSYGVAPPTSGRPDDIEATRLALAEAVPADHRAFLDSLKTSFTLGDYFFAHAGAAPGKPLSEQTPEDLMWIRGRFLDSPRSFEKVIVHGHSPSPHVHVDHRRIGIDTGAYLTGLLTALRLEDDIRGLVQTVREAENHIAIRTEPL